MTMDYSPWSEREIWPFLRIAISPNIYVLYIPGYYEAWTGHVNWICNQRSEHMQWPVSRERLKFSWQVPVEKTTV